MKLGPVTKPDKRQTTPKEFENDVMSKNCDVIAIFPIYDQSEAIQKPDSGGIVCKTENRTKKSLTQFSRYFLE